LANAPGLCQYLKNVSKLRRYSKLAHLPSADISTRIGLDAATVVNDGKENETDTSQDFDDAENELNCMTVSFAASASPRGCRDFTFTIAAHTKNLNDNQCDKEYSDPDTNI
jgi:hypothetical protein